VGVSGSLASLLQATIQRNAYRGTNAEVESVVVFLTARELLVVEDVSWVIRYAVFILVGGIVIRCSDLVGEGQGVGLASGDKRRDVQRWPLA